ncbi:hypothetical protein DTW90_13980 [Neorhizobium sp. P12A]|jgi:hypothetical protein|uniref:hypothetical protein n=1 Tax=Rhizobium/Agrobacterium group TaxID=227290 RepID=UPI001050F440|nr:MULTISPECIES: hypothetical protein [Rhizobium/Agrobacterium group]KAA0698855.1 hypothetical protein DTW90_13980 [Neorhizobium sp. P12A]TCR90177.1 hypothetical protein EV561_104405 [Rhizobium sp. BK376]
MISSPNFAEGDPRRIRDCQRAVLRELNDLIDRAVASGWKRGEVLVSIDDLVDAETAETGDLLKLMMGYLKSPMPDAA